MKKKYWTPNQELVGLVAQTVQTIAKHKGYAAYPKEVDIKLVLEALALVNIAIKECQDGTRRDRDKGTERAARLW